MGLEGIIPSGGAPEADPEAMAAAAAGSVLPDGPDLRPPTKYTLPDSLRAAVGGNFGELLQTDEILDHVLGAGMPPIAAVGDIVALTLHDEGIEPWLIVVDYKTKRGAEDARLREVLGGWGEHEARVDNPPATITREAWDAIRSAIHAHARPAAADKEQADAAVEAIRAGDKAALEGAAEAMDEGDHEPHHGPTRIVVEGEEDLLGIPCFLEMPTGSLVFYGKPDEGAVAVTITEDFRDVVRGIVAGMGKE